MDVDVIGYNEEAKTLPFENRTCKNLDSNDQLDTLTQDSMLRMTGPRPR